MRLTKTIKVLNAMCADGVIGHYAIGGAIAAFLYIEPGATFDIDAFISFDVPPSSLLSLAPIYAYLHARGYEADGETLMIEGWPVQFLPPPTPLVEEALRDAHQIKIEGETSWAFSREHLMAICLETGRSKDMARLVQFLEDGNADMTAFLAIVERHSLQDKWKRFKLLHN